MNIEQKQTKGCDKMSRVYSDMLNYLQEVMQDEEKLKNLSPLDYSALGMYIGKFVEQEINSSVVQIMRAFRGIEMPRYYCRWKSSGIVKPVVVNVNYYIFLNKKDLENRFSLKTISLGDAYNALEVLKKEDKDGFFEHYRWLYNTEFLDAWQKLFRFRNRMAHIGEIIDADIIKENYELFQQFLKFMPEISEAKKELMPRGYSQTVQSKKKTTERPYFAGTYYRDRPMRSVIISNDRDVGHVCCGRGGYFPDQPCLPKRPRVQKAQVDAKMFKLRKGRFGLKDCEGNILVPANYDAFGFLPKLVDDYKRESVIAIRDGRYFLVALDGSGRELTEESYDDIRLADNSKKNSPYVYRKNGRMLWGLMDESGNEICDNIIDNYICTNNSIMYESNELRGYWHFAEPVCIFLPPIFDDIEIMENPKEPLLFTLNGVLGHVRHDSTFVSLTDLEELDGEMRTNTLKCCVSEE